MFYFTLVITFIELVSGISGAMKSYEKRFEMLNSSIKQLQNMIGNKLFLPVALVSFVWTMLPYLSFLFLTSRFVAFVLFIVMGIVGILNTYNYLKIIYSDEDEKYYCFVNSVNLDKIGIVANLFVIGLTIYYAL